MTTPPTNSAANEGAKRSFRKGDAVRLKGERHSGFIVRAMKNGAMVEWAGFPPKAPTDGYYEYPMLRHAQHAATRDGKEGM